ncbi:MAG: hypothetical protein NTV68_00575, partial [Methanomicrobiales archaeon]|nr:hypothetical protein [Methanomicrobiales archaeon]
MNDFFSLAVTDIIDSINIFPDWNPTSGLYSWQIQKLSQSPHVDAHNYPGLLSGNVPSTELAWKPRGYNPRWKGRAHLQV